MGKEIKTHNILIYSNFMVFPKFENIIALRGSKHFTDGSYFQRKIIIKIGSNPI